MDYIPIRDGYEQEEEEDEEEEEEEEKYESSPADDFEPLWWRM